jgi:hypothetical protein
MARDCGLHRLAVLLPALRTTLDVGKQKCDRASRQSGRARSLSLSTGRHLKALFGRSVRLPWPQICLGERIERLISPTGRAHLNSLSQIPCCGHTYGTIAQFTP